MKYLDRLKKINRTTKIGLVGSVVYAASAFAFPAYAAVKEEKPKTEVITIEELERADTIEAADTLFHSKLEEYCSDKKLKSGEIRNLHTILVKKKGLFDERMVADERYTNLAEEATSLHKKIEDLEKKLSVLEEPVDIYRGKEKIKGLLEREFPGIFDEKKSPFNITYPSSEKIEQESLRVLVRDMARALNQVLKIDNEDEILDSILEKAPAYYTLKDVSKFFTLIEKYKPDIARFNESFKEKEALVKGLQDLKQKEKSILDELSDKENKILVSLSNSSGNPAKLLEPFSDYILFEDRAKEFIKNVEDISKYWSVCIDKRDALEEKIVLEDHRLEEEGVKDGYNSYYHKIFKKEKWIEKALNDYISSQGLNAKVNPLKDPSKYKFPAWLMYLGGSTLPIIRNLLVRRYIGDARQDAGAYGVVSLCGALNGLVGIFFLDGLHPWIFPIRMATPLVFEPLIRKIKFFGVNNK